MTPLMRVAAIPVGPAGDDPGAPWREVEAGVCEAAAAGAGLAVLPELTLLPYVAGEDPARWRHLAEAEDGPTARRMGALACRHGLALVFGLALREPGGRCPSMRRSSPDRTAASSGSRPSIGFRRRRPATSSARPTISAPVPRRRGPCGSGSRVVAPSGSRPSSATTGAFRRPGTRRRPGPTSSRCWSPGRRRRIRPASLPPNSPATPGACGVAAVAAARHGTEHGLGRPVRHDGDSLVVGPDGRLLAAWRPDAPGPVIGPVLGSLPDTVRLSLPEA